MDEFEEWFGKDIPKGEGLMAMIKGGPHEFTQENFIKALATYNKRRDDPLELQVSLGDLLNADDDMFKMIYSSDKIKCLCSTDGYNKVQWRAYKLKLIGEYKPI